MSKRSQYLISIFSLIVLSYLVSVLHTALIMDAAFANHIFLLALQQPTTWAIAVVTGLLPLSILTVIIRIVTSCTSGMVAPISMWLIALLGTLLSAWILTPILQRALFLITGISVEQVSGWLFYLPLPTAYTILVTIFWFFVWRKPVSNTSEL